MGKQIIVVCQSCEDTNKSLLGIDDFVVRQTEFESFSEAFDHMMEYRDHYMIISEVEDSK